MNHLLKVAAGCVFLWYGLDPSMEGQSIALSNAPRMMPPAYAVVTSESGVSTGPYITVVDETGDTIVAAQPLVSSVVEAGFAIDETGRFAESIGNGNSLNFFQANSTLAPASVGVNTLPQNSCIGSVAAPVGQLLALDVINNTIDIGAVTGASGAFAIAQGSTLPMTPVTVTGAATNSRYAIVSQNVPYGVACNNIATSVTATGQVTFLESSNDVLDSPTVPVGRCPVYAVTSADGQRSFVLNRGDDTVTVLNMMSAVVDSTVALPLLNNQHAGPVYAEYVASRGKLLVANYDNDTVSIVNVQLDSTGADGPAFGTVVATVDLWNGLPHVCVVSGQNVQCSKHPAAIAALPDGSRAYIAEQGAGTVDVLDLHVNQVVSTLSFPVPSILPSPVTAHPRTLAVVAESTTNSLFSKIYVGAPDSPLIPYIYVDDNVMFPEPCTQTSGCYVCNYSLMCSENGGNVIDLHVNTSIPTNGGTNASYSTRLPGAGQPCLAPKASPSNIADCFAH